LDKLVKESKNLLIISSEIEGEALSSLVMNKLRGVLNVLAVKAPGFGDSRKEMLIDIARLTEATFISDETGGKLENVRVEDLGRADKVIADKDSTILIGGKGDVSSRIKQITSQLDSASNYEKTKLQERISKLSNGVAVIKVGAPTETELKELKLRVEDAVRNTKAAVEEGIVAGGGTTYLRAREAIKGLKLDKEEKMGADILYKALENPIRCLLENSGAKASLKRIKGDIGFNVVSMKYVDMIKDGVVDSTKALRLALENAVSAATMILTTECVITEEVKEVAPQ
jgi:chaperonin GroEL